MILTVLNQLWTIMVKVIVNIGKEQLESATAIVYDGRSSHNPVSDADSPALMDGLMDLALRHMNGWTGC